MKKILPFSRLFSRRSVLRPGWLIVLAIGWLRMVAAAPVTEVSGEYTYYDDGTHTRNECVELALQAARADALAKEFGTIVSQDVASSSTGRGQREETRFFSNTMSSVRGEWVADTGEPKTEITLDADGNFVVKCKVKGKARALGNSALEFNASLLSASDKRAKASDFEHGQNIYLWVESPARPMHTLVCLIDEEGIVYRLFPYPTGKNCGNDLLSKGYDYILFDSNRKGDDFGLVEEILAMAPDGPELNKVYVIGSPNPLGSAPWHDNGPGTLSTMKLKDFNEWVVKLMRNDEEVGRRQLNLRITPKESGTHERIRY